MIKIKNIKISQKNKPIIIAEMSGNHNQSLNRALKIVDAAAECGVHMLKLQTYTPDTMTLNINSSDFLIKNKKSLWYGKYLYNLYKEAYTPWKWHAKIMNKAKKRGLICFSSAFDETSVDFLEKLKVPLYKIASFENTDLPLIRKIASTGKPVIVSTGMASLSEIKDIVKTLKSSGCKKYILLKCTSSYPAPPNNSNVKTIPEMIKKFKCEIGLSDHTLGIGAALSAIAHGATVIEKHFTLNRKDGGVDSAFSLEPDEMKLLVKESEIAWRSVGKIKYGPTKIEKNSMIFRRSLYVCQNIKKGESFSKENLRIIRPGNGIKPKFYDKIIGCIAKKSLKKGTALKWRFIDKKI